jgi:hypothetical protein
VRVVVKAPAQVTHAAEPSPAVGTTPNA